MYIAVYFLMFWQKFLPDVLYYDVMIFQNTFFKASTIVLPAMICFNKLTISDRLRTKYFIFCIFHLELKMLKPRSPWNIKEKIVSWSVPTILQNSKLIFHVLKIVRTDWRKVIKTHTLYVLCSMHNLQQQSFCHKTLKRN